LPLEEGRIVAGGGGKRGMQRHVNGGVPSAHWGGDAAPCMGGNTSKWPSAEKKKKEMRMASVNTKGKGCSITKKPRRKQMVFVPALEKRDLGPTYKGEKKERKIFCGGGEGVVKSQRGLQNEKYLSLGREKGKRALEGGRNNSVLKVRGGEESLAIGKRKSSLIQNQWKRPSRVSVNISQKKKDYWKSVSLREMAHLKKKACVCNWKKGKETRLTLTDLSRKREKPSFQNMEKRTRTKIIWASKKKKVARRGGGKRGGGFLGADGDAEKGGGDLLSTKKKKKKKKKKNVGGGGET